jgi:putative hemolysin
LIASDDRRFLQNVFRSSQLRADEIAVPRTRLVAAPIDSPVSDVLKLAADSAYTRIPIYDGDIDHIVGFVHLRDLFTLYRTDETADIRSIMRPVPFVPETLTSVEVWERLDEAESYLAIVFDEYGGTSGMITREDLVEELFGELQDEFDQEQALISSADAGRISVRGDMLISTLNALLDINLPHEVSHTVGGLVMDSLGRIPKVGDTVEIQGVELRVEAVDHNSVTEVCVTLPSGELA